MPPATGVSEDAAYSDSGFMKLMATAHALPVEIWIHAASGLAFTDLLHLSLSCTQLRDICADRLSTLRELRRKYRSFDAGEASKIDRFPWHALLLKILRGEICASYVVETNLDAVCITSSEYPTTSQPGFEAPYLSTEDKELLSSAVDSSAWIYDNESQNCLRKICDGDEDAVLCVLVPLLTNLRNFCVPINVVLLQVIIGRIAQASAKHQAATGLIEDQQVGVPKALPLRKLVQVWAKGYNGHDFGITLGDIAPFTALPSVRRIHLQGLRDDEFGGWPENVPYSQVHEVYFTDSSIAAAAVCEFAKGFESFCLMRQDFTPDDIINHDVEWDHYEISGEIDAITGRIREGTRRDKMETKHCSEDHRVKPTWLGGVYRRSSIDSDGMNAFFDGSLWDWQALVPDRDE